MSLWLTIALAMAGVSPSATIVGTVTLAAADGSTRAGEGARVALTCGAARTMSTDMADDHGAFRFLNVPMDRCSIEADVQGFLAQPLTVVIAAREVVEIELRLGVAPLRAGVNVGGPTPFTSRRCRPDPAGLTRVRGDRRNGVSAESATIGVGSFWEKAVFMSQRTIERVIGRLLTDEELRHEFIRSPSRTVADLNDQGWELSRLEVDALLAIEIGLWSEVAARIDPRLQRCSLRTQDVKRDNAL